MQSIRVLECFQAVFDSLGLVLGVVASAADPLDLQLTCRYGSEIDQIRPMCALNNRPARVCTDGFA